MDIEKQDIKLQNILNKYFSDLHIHCRHIPDIPYTVESQHELASCFYVSLANEIVSFGLVKERIVSMLEDELKLVQEKLRQVKEKTEGEKSNNGDFDGE